MEKRSVESQAEQLAALKEIEEEYHPGFSCISDILAKHKAVCSDAQNDNCCEMRIESGHCVVLVRDLCDWFNSHHHTALTLVHQQGQAAGLEEAADLLEHEGYRLEHNVPQDMWVPTLYAKECRRRAAIRNPSRHQ